MTVFVDTSVLVAAFIPGHIHHQRSFAVFSAADLASATCAAHSLAEVYATITRLPHKYRVSAQQALTFMESIEERFALVALGPKEYRQCIREAAARNVVGGTVYDALVAACALKAGANVLYTWNVGHFILLGNDIAKRVRTP